MCNQLLWINIFNYFCLLCVQYTTSESLHSFLDYQTWKLVLLDMLITQWILLVDHDDGGDCGKRYSHIVTNCLPYGITVYCVCRRS